MKNFAILLATMCIFAHATSVFQTPAFLEIKSTPFGSSISALVELNMSHSGRLDAIAEVLNAVHDTLSATQQHNNEEISRERGWCNDQQNEIKNQIHDAEDNLHKKQEEQEKLTNEQSDLNVNLNKERESLRQNQDNLANTESQLNEENERFILSAKQYAEAIAAGDQALNLLATLRANPSALIQTKAKFGNVVVLLQKHLSNKSSSFIQPVLAVLLELSTSSEQLDQAKLSKVVSLIEQLLNELRNQQSQDQQKNKQTVDSLSQQISDLKQLIEKSQDNIQQDESRLREIADRLQILVEGIATVSALLENSKTQLQQTEDTCAGYESNFQEVDAEINQQIATLEKLKQYFKEHVVTSVENVRDSSNTDQLTVPL